MYNNFKEIIMKLKKLREEKGLSQYEIAPLLNIKRATYANYENEITQPPIEILCRIADYYNVTLDYLCDHRTPYQTELGYLDENDKKIMELVKELTEINKIKAISYLSGLIAGQ